MKNTVNSTDEKAFHDTLGVCLPLMPEHFETSKELYENIIATPESVLAYAVLNVARHLFEEAGIKIHSIANYAIMIEFSENSGDVDQGKAMEIMQRASEYVLGKPIRSVYAIYKIF